MMPGIFGIVGNCSNRVDINYLVSTINPLGLCKVQITDSGKLGIFAVASLRNAPLKEDLCFNDANWTILLAGDLIGELTVPWKDIIDIFEEESYGEFKKLRGIFALAAFNKIKKKLFIISDRRSQYPVYYYFNNEIRTYIFQQNYPHFAD